MKIRQLSLALSTLALASLCGCALSQLSASGADAISAEDRGRIEKTDFSPETWIYHHPQQALTEYTKVLVSPVRIYENMASEVKKRDRRYLNEVAQTFQRRLVRTLEKDYLPVTEPDPLTLRIELELTELKPSMRVFKDRREKTKLGGGVSGTKMEASCYDTVSGELIFALATFYTGDEYAAHSKPVLITNLRGAYGEWLEYFKKRFDEAMTFL